MFKEIFDFPGSLRDLDTLLVRAGYPGRWQLTSAGRKRPVFDCMNGARVTLRRNKRIEVTSVNWRSGQYVTKDLKRFLKRYGYVNDPKLIAALTRRLAVALSLPSAGSVKTKRRIGTTRKTRKRA